MSTYVSKAPNPATVTAPSSTRARTVAAAAVLLFAVSLFFTVASVNVPHDASDAELVKWWQDTGHLNATLASEFFSISAAVLFLVFSNYLRTLFRSSGMPQWSAFAHSMSAAFAAMMLVTSALRAVIGHMVQVYDDPLPGVDVLRYSTALDYALLGTAAMATLALSMVAVSVVVIRSKVLGTWVGYVGLVGAAIVFVAVAMMVGAYAIPVVLLWALCMAVAIWRQPAA